MGRIVSLALYVIACALLVVCLFLLALTIVLMFSSVALAVGAGPLALEITRAMPAWLAMLGVVASPFGGVFRTDFLIVTVAALVAAKILRRIAKGLS